MELLLTLKESQTLPQKLGNRLVYNPMLIKLSNTSKSPGSSGSLRHDVPTLVFNSTVEWILWEILQEIFKKRKLKRVKNSKKSEFIYINISDIT